MTFVPGLVLHLPAAPVALRAVLDAAATPAADPDDGPHVGEVAVAMLGADGEVDLCLAIGTLLTLRGLGLLAFPDAGAPVTITPSGRHLLAATDRVNDAPG